jgi:LuxR family maltose regulon positive regulatory protein
MPATLIRTKLQRPLLPGDLIPRRQLMDRLHAGSSLKLTLISAEAGAGKTTLLAQWLEECSQPSAWLSLDKGDNDPIVFLTYLCAAIRSVFPTACEAVLDLLSAVEPPKAQSFIAPVVNELARLLAGPPDQAFAAHGDQVSGPASQGPSKKGLILALDDYHVITEPEIDEILSGLVQNLPQGIHLALATRVDPRLPLARLRARGKMTEVRSVDLRLSLEEAQTFLERTTGRELDPETIRLLEDKTEGWIVGLRLAALSLRTLSDDGSFVRRFNGTSSVLIVEYLANEVLAQQPPEIQNFALRTSLVDRICAPLGEAMTGDSPAKSQEILQWVAHANLFLVPLDDGGDWYRYHPLFRDLLLHKLRQQTGSAVIASLHRRAGDWFAQNGWIEEALQHFSAIGDMAAAVAVVARERYTLLNEAHWARLERYLKLFSPDIADQSPELLMTRAWLLYHRGRYAELVPALQDVEESLARAALDPEAIDSLLGEISTLHSYVSILALDVEGAIAQARQALTGTPRELWSVRVLARLCLASALLMTNGENGAYETVYASFEAEGDQSNAFKATLLATACNIHWMTADLLGLARAAEQVLALSQDPYSPAFRAWGHYHLGRVYYQQGDLATAEEHFAAVVRQPYVSYGICYVNSACGLALTCQAQGQPERAREVAETAVAFLLETGNTTLLPVALAFRAELAVMQGQIAAASQQAARFDPVPPLSPMYGLFSAHLTLVKVWLAQDTPASRERATELLGRVEEFCKFSHTTRFLIEALALQALLLDTEGDEPAALAALERAVALAEPGGFLRLFVDLGRPLDRLLDRLRGQGVAPGYITRILAAFETKGETSASAGGRTMPEPSSDPPSAAHGASSPLVEPLTPREMEVLELLGRHLTNKEIAAELVISPDTVKSHTLSIYSKLDVRRRQLAVARARTLDILPRV